MLNESMRCELVGKDRIFNYITGGKGVVTLQSSSGVHHTYQFSAPDSRKEGEDTMFVYTLIDNNSWVYVGMYKDKSFRLTKKSKFPITSPIVKGVAFILKLMLKPDYSDERMHLFHEGVCARCGRPLTNPDSIEIGMGPVCRDMM